MIHRLSSDMILDRIDHLSELKIMNVRLSLMLELMPNWIPRAKSFETSITTLFMTYATGNQAQGESPSCDIGRQASGALPLGMGRVRTCWLRLTLMVSWFYSTAYRGTSCIEPSPSRISSSARRIGQCSRVLTPQAR